MTSTFTVCTLMMWIR